MSPTISDAIEGGLFSRAASKHVPTKHEIETFTGLYVDTEYPRPNTIRLVDIAHALSQTCRFNGHTRTFYSVAEHAVLVSRRIEELGYARYWCMGGLHHDDAEAYLGDVCRPLKLHIGEHYDELSVRMDVAICSALNVDGPPWIYPDNFHHDIVKDADNWALMLEARHLLPSKGINWAGSSIAQEPGTPEVDPDYWTGGLSPVEAEGLFLSRHHELTGSPTPPAKWEPPPGIEVTLERPAFERPRRGAPELEERRQVRDIDSLGALRRARELPVSPGVGLDIPRGRRAV